MPDTNIIIELFNKLDSKLDSHQQKVQDKFDKINDKFDDINEQAGAFKVFCAEQVRINSKLNGITTIHFQLIDKMPDTIKREVFGEVNKLREKVESVEKEHSEENSDKRKTKLGIISHSITSLVTLLLGWLGLFFSKFYE